MVVDTSLHPFSKELLYLDILFSIQPDSMSKFFPRERYDNLISLMVPMIDVTEEPPDSIVDPMEKFSTFLDEQFYERCDKIGCERINSAKYVEVKGKVTLIGIERVSWRDAERRNRVRVNVSDLDIIAYICHIREYFVYYYGILED